MKAATSFISDCLMTPSAESLNFIDVSLRKANSQWCRTNNGMNNCSPVVDSFNHFTALLGFVVAVGRKSGLTKGMPVSFFSAVKNMSRSVLDQSAPFANNFDDGIGLCGIWQIFSHLSFAVVEVNELFDVVGSSCGGSGGLLSCVTLSSSR